LNRSGTPGVAPQFPVNPQLPPGSPSPYANPENPMRVPERTGLEPHENEWENTPATNGSLPPTPAELPGLVNGDARSAEVFQDDPRIDRTGNGSAANEASSEGPRLLLPAMRGSLRWAEFCGVSRLMNCLNYGMFCAET